MAYRNFIAATLLCLYSISSFAGYELVCNNQSPQTNHKTIKIDCSDRQMFIKVLGAAWRELRQNSIGGHLENMCWEAHNQAKELHPSISFEAISGSFLIRCNMGLAYAK
jgi:hypothetical protein